MFVCLLHYKMSSIPRFHNLHNPEFYTTKPELIKNHAIEKASRTSIEKLIGIHEGISNKFRDEMEQAEAKGLHAKAYELSVDSKEHFDVAHWLRMYLITSHK